MLLRVMTHGVGWGEGQRREAELQIQSAKNDKPGLGTKFKSGLYKINPVGPKPTLYETKDPLKSYKRA